MKALDLTNQRFGNLIALERAPKRNDKYTRWLCQCDCGNTTEVRTDFLRNGHTISCGCKKIPHFGRTIFEGQKYGKLTVITPVNSTSYKCQCDCGNTTIVKGYNLTNGNTQSCGCLKSKGELKINQILTDLNIDFKTQYSFNDCKFLETGKLAYFDYAIFKNKKLYCLIEYDGTQHTTGWGQSTESLNIIKARDSFKDYYCYLNNIPLIRISYKDYEKIDKNYILNILEEADGLDVDAEEADV